MTTELRITVGSSFMANNEQSTKLYNVCVSSYRFITYSTHKRKTTAEFLCHHFLNEQRIEAIGT